MKNILIIRSANNHIIDKLINHINIKYNEKKIYILLQESLVNEYKKKYKNIKLIENSDGFFNYTFFKKNRKLKDILSNIKWDCIYIPSSLETFYDFEQIFLIANSIKSKKYYLFTRNNGEKKVDLKKANIIFRIILNEIEYELKRCVCLIIIVLIYILYYPYNKLKKTNIFRK